jgi:hypothetical protein
VQTPRVSSTSCAERERSARLRDGEAKLGGASLMGGLAACLRLPRFNLRRESVGSISRSYMDYDCPSLSSTAVLRRVLRDGSAENEDPSPLSRNPVIDHSMCIARQSADEISSLLARDQRVVVTRILQHRIIARHAWLRLHRKNCLLLQLSL